MHQQKHQHHSHQQRYNDYLSTSADNIQQQQYSKQKQQQHQTALYTHRHHHHTQQQQQQPQHHQEKQHQHQHQYQQRKHSQSHSPHQSRHTSPHSHHSHSLHSSPHQSHQHVNANLCEDVEEPSSPTRTAHSSHRASIQSSSSHPHHHHHHHRRRSRRHQGHHTGGSGPGSGNSSLHGAHGHSHHSQERTPSKQHGLNCSRRHRSTTDISSASLNTCHDPVGCVDREVQEIFVRKACCSSSRTELAQFFAEDLYGSSRRPSSCCTSSDYCYQTDSTSLYGSRSSLSRNNSVKSASVAMRKRRALHQRQPSYTSISLRGLNTQTAPKSHHQVGSLSSVFDRNRARLGDVETIESVGSTKVIVSPSKVTIERQTSKDALSQDLPDYACSPSPIRWSFLADEKSQSEIDTWKSDEGQQNETTQQPQQQQQQQQQPKPCRQQKPHRFDHKQHKSSQDDGPSNSYNTKTTTTKGRKFSESPFSCDFEETSTTVLFHQEGEAYNNCCNNYIQCNTYLDQDLQITSEDIHQYLSKGSQNGGDILNNSKSYPFQPSNALEFQYKNNFANTGPGTGTGTGTGTTTTTTAESSEVDSVREVNTSDSRYDNNNRRLHQNTSKETNLNNNWGSETSGACAILPSSSTPLSATNINLSSSTNNINIIFSSSSANTPGANEVKFINTTRRNVSASTDSQHPEYLTYTPQATTYDYTNMSSNSLFNKPLGIDELPKEFDSSSHKQSMEYSNRAGVTNIHTETSSSDGQHSSPLPSPVQKGVSFESFDASSDHNLISQRGSCQFSSPTPCSPLSPGSPACSSLSATVNPSASCYVYEQIQQQQAHNYHNYSQQQEQQQHRHQHHHHHHHHRSSASNTIAQHGHYSHNYDCHYQHVSESFKLSNAFKKVRKRARKYTEFLRKK